MPVPGTDMALRCLGTTSSFAAPFSNDVFAVPTVQVKVVPEIHYPPVSGAPLGADQAGDAAVDIDG